MSGVFHGGGLDAAIAKYGGKCEDWLDLSTGINPNPYPVPKISPEVWARLPDKGAEQALLDAAREYYRVPEGFEIVAAQGTQSLIQSIPHLHTVSRMTVFSPTYNEHGYVWSNAGTEVCELTSWGTMPSEADAATIVNPNNPTADILDTDEILNLSRQVKFLIVDEAFCDAMPECSIVPQIPDNVIVLKSFGKFFGLAGLRLGFAICTKEWASKLKSMLGPWAVSGPALQIGLCALNDLDWIEGTRLSLSEKSSELASLLIASGLDVQGQAPLFVYARSNDAKCIYEQLAKHRVLVRPFPEQPNYLRFGLCKNQDEFARLEAGLKAYGNV